MAGTDPAAKPANDPRETYRREAQMSTLHTIQPYVDQKQSSPARWMLWMVLGVIVLAGAAGLILVLALK